MNSGGLSERLSLLIGTGSVTGFAKRCGIPEANIRSYLKGTVPKVDNAAAISDAAGVSLDWLITGRGEMRPLMPGNDVATHPVQPQEEPVAPPLAVTVDGKLLGRVIELVMQAHEELGSTLPKQYIGQIAARIYSQLIAAPAPEGREGQFNLLKTQLREEILLAYNEPGKGKASV